MRLHSSALVGPLILISLTGLTGCKNDQPVAEKPRPVRTVISALHRGGQVFVQTGEIRPSTETDLGFRIDGRITTRVVDVGAIVTAGEVLATLDDTNVANELRAAEADLAGAVASEDLAKVGLDRQKVLLERRIVAQARLDEADANRRSATARRESAASALANARSKLGYTKLVATTDGVVTAVGANPGQVVSAGQMVARIASGSGRDAVFNVAESVINANAGDPDFTVDVALVSDPAVRSPGRLRDVSPTADPTTRTYRARIALPPEAAAMPFGAAVTGSVRAKEGDEIALPAASLTSAAGAPAVYLVDPATKTILRKTVTVTRYTDKDVFVSQGLAVGDVVVTAGVSKLRPGQAVAFEGDAR